jgi:hypothetical protein
MLVAASPMVGFEPTRISKTASIELNGPIEKVFPLFGPIREKEWAHGWEPEIVFGESDAEEHMIFKTRSGFADEKQYTWILSKLDQKNYLVEYTVSSTDRIWFITVQCAAHGEKTIASITYTYTSFSDLAQEKNSQSLIKMYSENLKDWEKAINHYLHTGKKLTH